MNARLPLKIQLLRPILLKLRPAVLASFVKRLVGTQRTVVKTDVGSFLVDPISIFGDSLIRRGAYEPAMVKTLRRFLAPGSVFVDVGANEGFFSVLGGSIVGPKGRVLSVEPQLRLRAVFEQNLHLNELSNVTLCQVAVSSVEGTGDLHLSPDTGSGASGLVCPTRYRVTTQPVRTVTLSKLLADAKIEHVDVMKMDIEGFEYEAVFGSRELFEEGRITAFALELHPGPMRRRGVDPKDLIDFLRSCGFRQDRSHDNTVFVWGGALIKT